MSKLIDHVWLWGQTPNSHHACAAYNLPGVNRMTPREGCDFFGIRNCCRVAMSKGPFPPFDEESRALQDLDRVVYSVIGAGGVRRNEENNGDLDEVIRQAKIFPNIMAGIMDDFLLSERRRAIFTPEKLREIRNILHTAAGRELEFWTVYYDRELDLAAQDYLEEFDGITFWTWYGENLTKLETNLNQVRAANPNKRHLAGCYMWDYGNGKPLSPEQMLHQLEVYRQFMLEGKLQGIILCSNCIADLGIAAVDQTREYLQLHGKEDVPF